MQAGEVESFPSHRPGLHAESDHLEDSKPKSGGSRTRQHRRKLQTQTPGFFGQGSCWCMNPQVLHCQAEFGVLRDFGSGALDFGTRGVQKSPLSSQKPANITQLAAFTFSHVGHRKAPVTKEVMAVLCDWWLCRSGEHHEKKWQCHDSGQCFMHVCTHKFLSAYVHTYTLISL